MTKYTVASLYSSLPGENAGATLEHPHSQLIALPVVPKRVIEEMEGAKRHFDYRERCIYCDIIQHEAKAQQRVVLFAGEVEPRIPVISEHDSPDRRVT